MNSIPLNPKINLRSREKQIHVDTEKLCAKIRITNTDKSVDEEEYMRFRMNREKMAGENLRDGSMEVAFELWIERILSQ